VTEYKPDCPLFCGSCSTSEQDGYDLYTPGRVTGNQTDPDNCTFTSFDKLWFKPTRAYTDYYYGILSQRDVSRPQPSSTKQPYADILVTPTTRFYHLTDFSQWETIYLEGHGNSTLRVKSASTLLAGDDPITGESDGGGFSPPLSLYSYPDWSPVSYFNIPDGTNRLHVNFTYIPEKFIPSVLAIQYQYLYPPL